MLVVAHGDIIYSLPTTYYKLFFTRDSRLATRYSRLFAFTIRLSSKPAKVGERLVRFRHAMRIFFFLHRITGTVVSINQFLS